jgi:hypothetical protein
MTEMKFRSERNEDRFQGLLVPDPYIPLDPPCNQARRDWGPKAVEVEIGRAANGTLQRRVGLAASRHSLGRIGGGLTT